MSPYLNFSEEVLEAKENNKPIVALESTIISHGMPYPQNMETAFAVEHIIREEGAVPATIALYQGKIQIGFTETLMTHFATDKSIEKASTRDMAFYLSQGVSASTTVAATMHAAHLAEVFFFATGGIGGVHRQAEKTFDISTDLHALSNTPVLVVSAGAKAILDIDKTLEVLETLAVPVIGYQTERFPAFYSHSSPHQLTMRMDNPKDIVTLFKTQRELKLKNGLLVANPIPKEHQIPHETISPLIEEALSKMGTQKGKEVTPYLLKEIARITQGKSLEANIALIKHNAKLAAKLAVTAQEAA
jgi:pseudouridine-5'-phosphate glycosidase